MKLIKFIGMVAALIIAWKFSKNNKQPGQDKKQGPLSRLVDGLKEEVKKPISEIDDSIPSPQTSS